MSVVLPNYKQSLKPHTKFFAKPSLKLNTYLSECDLLKHNFTKSAKQPHLASTQTLPARSPQNFCVAPAK
jgi:hypothetical protein